MTDLRVHPLAENEIGQAARFYEGRVPGLGKDFIAEVAHCFGRMQDFPQLGSADPEGFRRTFLRRFPYAVVYELVPLGILVLAVAHQRRRPGYWRGRGQIV